MSGLYETSGKARGALHIQQSCKEQCLGLDVHFAEGLKFQDIFSVYFVENSRYFLNH